MCGLLLCSFFSVVCCLFLLRIMRVVFVGVVLWNVLISRFMFLLVLRWFMVFIMKVVCLMFSVLCRLWDVLVLL